MNTVPAEPASPQTPTVKTPPILVAKDWSIVSALAVVIIVLWIGVSVYHVLTTSTVPEPQERRLTMFSLQLDDEVIGNLVTRKQLAREELDEDRRVLLLEEGAETISLSAGESTVPP